MGLLQEKKQKMSLNIHGSRMLLCLSAAKGGSMRKSLHTFSTKKSAFDMGVSAKQIVLEIKTPMHLLAGVGVFSFTRLSAEEVVAEEAAPTDVAAEKAAAEAAAAEKVAAEAAAAILAAEEARISAEKAAAAEKARIAAEEAAAKEALIKYSTVAFVAAISCIFVLKKIGVC